MVSERGLAVLHAIVSDFVDSGEAVGSRAIVERHAFGVSAATIRNDMALLEEEELIAAPHTSSGRVPTDKGYRLYVDTLSRIRPLSAAQRAAIEQFLSEPYDLDDLMARTVRLLAGLTNQVAVIQYPSLLKTVVRHVELVQLGMDRVLCVLITGTGVVEQQTVQLPGARLTEEWLHDLKRQVAAEIVGSDIEHAAERVRQLMHTLPEWVAATDDDYVRRVLTVLWDQLQANRTQRISIAGAANLTRPGETMSNLAAVLEAIEEQVALLRLFGELATDDRGLGASIGRENLQYGLESAAVIATDYETSGDSVARLGVLGPTRMDYAGNIAAVRAVARYLNTHLRETGS